MSFVIYSLTTYLQFLDQDYTFTGFYMFVHVSVLSVKIKPFQNNTSSGTPSVRGFSTYFTNTTFLEHTELRMSNKISNGKIWNVSYETIETFRGKSPQRKHLCIDEFV